MIITFVQLFSSSIVATATLTSAEGTSFREVDTSNLIDAAKWQ
jgi:hypothetical protein